MAAKFEDSKKFALNKSQLLDKVKMVIEKCNFEIKSFDKDLGLIQAKTKISLWSWSENIEVRIQDDGHVKVKSECSLPSQFIDWGKNKRNVKQIFESLT